MMQGTSSRSAVHTNIDLLKQNIELNLVENVSVLSGAISDKNGSADFHLSYQSNLNTFTISAVVANTFQVRPSRLRPRQLLS